VRTFSAISVALILGFLSAVAYCGRKAGQWENDPANWKRAFGTPPPGTLQVIHSFYSRSPHPFMLEHHYAFHIKSPLSFPNKWVAESGLKKPDPKDWSKIESLKGNQPPWFAPKPMDAYEVYLLQDQAFPTFGIFIDREVNEWFVTDRS
jgi:hypothetical protein